MYILLKINEKLLPFFSYFLKSHALPFLLLYLLPILVPDTSSLLTSHCTEATLESC